MFIKSMLFPIQFIVQDLTDVMCWNTFDTGTMVVKTEHKPGLKPFVSFGISENS